MNLQTTPGVMNRQLFVIDRITQSNPLTPSSIPPGAGPGPDGVVIPGPEDGTIW